jgi:hypothetical protein
LDEELARDDRIRELERKVDVLTDELERTRSEIVVPELPELKSQYGMGPAASKIYDVVRGLSIGGYGEGYYRALVDDKGSGSNEADWLRMVLYAGYKFTENIVFNSEIEWEHAGEEVSVEFAALDFLWRDEANFRAGILLVPMGFLNEVHEPPFFFGVNRPEPEQRIIPSTWRENGVGVFGTLLGEQVQYKAYVVNGLNAAGFSQEGLRGGRQKGSEALAEHLAFVGKLDFTPTPGLLFGGSVYLGNSGQNQNIAGNKIPDTFTAIWELHSEYKANNLSLRALFTMAHLQDAGALSTSLQAIDPMAFGGPVANTMMGAYGEVAYDVWKCLFPESDVAVEPFFRFEFLDTQFDTPGAFARDKTQEQFIYTTGLSYKPIPNVVIKADYRNKDPQAGSAADEVNLGVGFAF